MQAELQEWLVLAPERLSTPLLPFPPPPAGVLPCVAYLAAFTLRARSTPLRLRAWRVSRKRSRQRGLDFSGEDMRALLLVGRGGGQGDATPSARRAQRRARRSRAPARRRSFVLRHLVPRLLGALVRPPRGFAVRA